MKDKQRGPMDDGVRENKVGAPSTNAARICYAIKTLVSEVHSLFPETPVEYSNYDGRNTALAVTFDLTVLDGGDSVLFNNLISLLDTDPRVAEVIVADYDQAYVAMRSNPRTQDSRDAFGLADAFHVLVGGDDGDDDVIAWSDEAGDFVVGGSW